MRVLLVWCGVGCGGCRGSPRTSAFVWGHRAELWRASDWLKNDKKKLKVKQSGRTRVCLGYIRPKTGTLRFGPMAGLVGCFFLLDFRIACFWPQADQVYLFLAADPANTSGLAVFRGSLRRILPVLPSISWFCTAGTRSTGSISSGGTATNSASNRCAKD